MDIGPWAASRLPPRGPAERGFLKLAGAGFGVNGGSGPVRGKSVSPASGTRRACRVFGGVCGNENRPAERTISDRRLDTQAPGGPQPLRAAPPGQFGGLRSPAAILECAIAPEFGENRATGPSAGANRVPRRCNMSDAMARRRKINTRVGRLAARERVRELVSEHDDQVVLLIWGGRVLGWSLRRIAAALEGSAAPPGRRAGYTAGSWTAAAVQRICRRYGIPTDRPAPPPRGLLDSLRGEAGPSR